MKDHYTNNFHKNHYTNNFVVINQINKYKATTYNNYVYLNYYKNKLTFFIRMSGNRINFGNKKIKKRELTATGLEPRTT